MYKPGQIEAKPLIYNKLTQKVITPAEQESRENESTKLPDLYIRKIRLLERLSSLRRDYLPPSSSFSMAPNPPSISNNIPHSTTINNRYSTSFGSWDYVLREMKAMAIEFQEERKSKQACAYLCSRRIMKNLKLESVRKKELVLYHRLISSELANLIQQDFGNYLSSTATPSSPQLATLAQQEPEQEMEEEHVLDIDVLLKPKSQAPSSPLIQKKAAPFLGSKKKHSTKPNPVASSSISKVSRGASLLSYMEKVVRTFGREENCKKIDKMATWEDLARLFKRFPKKNKNLKSNVPDIFNQFNNGPMSPKEEGGGGRRRRKGWGGRDEGGRVNEWSKGEWVLNFRKSKNPENFDEILMMHYNEGKIGDGEYQKMFANSIENSTNFPKVWDDVPYINMQDEISERDWRYNEPTFDEHYERNDKENQLDLSKFVSSLDFRMKNYYEGNKLHVNYDLSFLKKAFEKEEINLRELVYSYPSLTKNFLVIQQKGKFRLFKEIPMNSSFLETHLLTEWPPGLIFLLTKYVNTFGMKWNLIADALNVSFIGRNFMITEEVCEKKWLSYLSRCSSHRMIDLNSRLHPSKKAIFYPKNEEIPTPEQKQAPQEKIRKTHYNHFIVPKLSEPDYHRFRFKYPAVRSEPSYLALHPKEKTSNILDSILAGVAARPNKDIEGFMKLENDPIIQVHPSENQKAWDPNNLLESLGFDESRKKLGNVPFMNSRRKKLNIDKVIPTLTKIIHESKQRTYSHNPQNIPNSIPMQPPPQGYLPMNYQKMPMAPGPNPMLRPNYPETNGPTIYEASNPNPNYNVAQQNMMNMPPQMLNMRPQIPPQPQPQPAPYPAAYPNNKPHIIRPNGGRQMDPNMMPNNRGGGMVQNMGGNVNMRIINQNNSESGMNGNVNRNHYQMSMLNTVGLKSDGKNNKKMKN